MDVEAQSALSVLNPSLARMIEDAILFGRLDEMDVLLENIADHPDVSDELRYGLEGLRYFRAHYASDMSQMPEVARQRVSRFDNDWSMQLIDILRGDQEQEAGEEKALG